MRQLSLVLLIAVLVASFGMGAWAAQEEQVVKGTVLKIDPSVKSVSIQTKEGGTVVVVMENANLLSRVKEGDKAEARYVVKDGKNFGIKLKKLIEGCE